MMAVRSVINERFNPRSLTGATGHKKGGPQDMAFQSTLPYGSDLQVTFARKIRLRISPLRERPAEPRERAEAEHFNPRSLTGATPLFRRNRKGFRFQSTLPYGSDIYHIQAY